MIYLLVLTSTVSAFTGVLISLLIWRHHDSRRALSTCPAPANQPQTAQLGPLASKRRPPQRNSSYIPLARPHDPMSLFAPLSEASSFLVQPAEKSWSSLGLSTTCTTESSALRDAFKNVSDDKLSEYQTLLMHQMDEYSQSWS